MSKLYKVLEHLTENDTAKASQLFHEHVVETARKIYSEMDMYDDEEFDNVDNQGFDGFIDEDNTSDDLEGDMQDLDAEEMDTMDQSGSADFDMDTGDDMGGDELGGDMGGDDLEGGLDDDGMGDDGLGDDELGGDMGDEDSRIADLESAFEQLQAQFEQLTSEVGGGDMGDDDLGGDEGDEEVSFDMDDDSEGGDEGDEGEYNFDSDDEGDEEEEATEEPVKESIKLKPAAGGKKVPVINKKGEKATSLALNGGPLVKGAGKPTNVNQGVPSTASYAKPSKIKTDKVKGMDNVDNNTRPIKLTPKAAPKAAKKGK